MSTEAGLESVPPPVPVLPVYENDDATRVEVSTHVTEPEWNAFVGGHPDATSYHLYGWRTILERAFRHPTEYLVARQNGNIVGVLPLVLVKSWIFGTQFVSLPFVNYGGVLATGDASARALLTEAEALARRRRAPHIELRHRTSLFPELPARQHKSAMLLDLSPGRPAVWNGFDKRVRNQIRKAEKSGLAAESGRAELLDDFYTIFARNMRDLGTPVYPRSFFQQMFEQFPAHTRIFVVRCASRPIASAISFRHRSTLEVPSASLLKEYRHLCPGNLLYWTMIQDAQADGVVTFDFGRSTPGEGTYHFKKQWGTEAQPLCWEYRLFARGKITDRSPNNPRFRAAIATWKRLPVFVTTTLGPAVVRHIP